MLPVSFLSVPGSLSMQAFVLESKIKMGKNVCIPWVMKIRIQMSVGTLILPNIRCKPSQVVEVILYKTPSCVKWSSWGRGRWFTTKVVVYLHSSLSRNGGAGWVSAIAYLCSSFANSFEAWLCSHCFLWGKTKLEGIWCSQQACSHFFQVNKARCLRALLRRCIVR